MALLELTELRQATHRQPESHKYEQQLYFYLPTYTNIVVFSLWYFVEHGNKTLQRLVNNHFILKIMTGSIFIIILADLILVLKADTN